MVTRFNAVIIHNGYKCCMPETCIRLYTIEKNDEKIEEK